MQITKHEKIKMYAASSQIFVYFIRSCLPLWFEVGGRMFYLSRTCVTAIQQVRDQFGNLGEIQVGKLREIQAGKLREIQARVSQRPPACNWLLQSLRLRQLESGSTSRSPTIHLSELESICSGQLDDVNMKPYIPT